ncbi:hypothetical protein ACLKMY_24135 [Paraburkholderia mimosarum]|uniref:hypothetical protein n=1 Tax=Paraburkholderia mimosarum TaxID=312026 RepID=UPI0039C0A8E9
MLIDPRRDKTGPWECPYCGTRLNTEPEICPLCGAKQLVATFRTAVTTEGIPDEHLRVTDRLRVYLGALQRNPGGRQFKDDDYPSIDEEGLRRRPRRPLYAWAALGALVTSIMGYAGLHRSEWKPKLGEQVVEGGVTGLKNKLAALTTNARSAQAMAAQPGVTSETAPPIKTPPPSPGHASVRPDIIRNMTNARAGLDSNSLSRARKAVMNVLAVQPENANVQHLRAELVAREQQRDMLIASARLCAHDRKWACERKDAERAMQIDASSHEARQLLALANSEKPVAARRTRTTSPPESQYARADHTSAGEPPKIPSGKADDAQASSNPPARGAGAQDRRDPLFGHH